MEFVLELNGIGIAVGIGYIYIFWGNMMFDVCNCQVTRTELVQSYLINRNYV